MTANAVESELMTIGAVLDLLQAEFPDMNMTVSKIRFLETEGLVEPVRTPSGYRKFSPADVERLRYTLRMQRDHFLPLRVIREHLVKLDRGFEPSVADSRPRVPEVDVELGINQTVVDLTVIGDDVSVTVGELADDTSIPIRDIVEMERSGMIKKLPGSDEFGFEAIGICRLVASLSERGLDHRHLRPIFSAANNQVDLLDRLLSPRANSTDARALQAEAEEVVTSLLKLQAIVVRAGVARTLS